ncbi:MAG: MbnP family protein [Pseudomonadota bacterium]
MKLTLPAVLLAGATALGGSLGCSSDTQNGAGPLGGTAGTSAASNLSGGGGANAGEGAVTDGVCPEHPTPQHAQGTLLSLSLQLVMAGKPFVFGQPNALPDGGSLIPINLRFYISEVKLLSSSGEPLAVDAVTEAGVPEPYGVHFFNAEDADSSTLRVLAPPGEYAGLSFALGLKLACNQQPPAGLSDPLTDSSQMTWPQTGGFLFLRYEGRYAAADGAGASGASSTDQIPSAVHMGGDITKELVPSVTVSGALSLPPSGTLEKGLNVVMDEIFKGATSNIDVSDESVGFLATADAVAGLRLRHDWSELHVFVLEP